MISSKKIRKIWRLNIEWHRDLGYFFSTIIEIYCLSGIALNHVDDWDPDFIITKNTVQLPATFTKSTLNDDVIKKFGEAVHEKTFKVYDFPTGNQVKIYYNNASLHVYLETGIGQYEKVAKRHFFYEVNVIHRNSLKEWKWISDIFAVALIAISITGMFILKGKYGLKRRGVWLMLAGFLLPIIAVAWFYF